MPIRLNLLAEAQAAEAARRRDPVKRAIWAAVLIIVVILVWSSSLQLKAILINGDVSSLQSQIKSHTNDYRAVLDDQNKIADIKHKLQELQRLSANRLLQGTLLEALQHSTVDDIQLMRFSVDQTYIRIEGTKSRTNDAKVFIPGKPATQTERILLTLEGADSSANPGDQLNKYKDALASNPYFKQVLVKTNAISLRNLAPPQTSPLTGKRSAIFTLECRYPEKTR
ncbi:MAG: hypothetical protein WCT12_08190 [Verrucomicrobiota bacterium]